MSGGVQLNDSATGGYLLPEGAAPPLYDLDLDLVFQALVVGITGIVGNFVRPRNAPKAPTRPEVDDTWCAAGVTLIDPEFSASARYDDTLDGGAGASVSTLHERITALMSFYGPRGQFYAMQFRHGILVDQNRGPLRLAGMGYVGAGPVRSVPTLVNNLTQRKYDVEVRVNRAVSRQYPIRYVLDMLGTLHAGRVSPVVLDTGNARNAITE